MKKQQVWIYGQAVVIVDGEAECQKCGFAIRPVSTGWYRMDAHCKSHYIDSIRGRSG